MRPPPGATLSGFGTVSQQNASMSNAQMPKSRSALWRIESTCCLQRAESPASCDLRQAWI